MSSFENLRIVDNFYQTSAFFPMPTVLVSTLTPDGQTSLGPYSLCQPYYIAGRDYYAMLLCTRNSSNTAQHLLRYGKCAINFIPDKGKYFKEAVRLGFPGDTPAEKMKNCLFTLEDGQMAAEHPDEQFPKVVAEAYQVMECTWMRELDHAQDDKPGELNGYPGPFHDFNGITSPFGAHFILRVDKILMKKRYRDAIINGVKARDFPPVPVDYGYRDSKNFWYTKFRRPHPELLPIRETSLSSVRYAADRADDTVKFTDEACAKLVKVPRIFLPTALKGCVAWAKENGVTLITAEHMDIINDKRAHEKGK
jgi:flavin reductase (DIM6/NTAB) family NADH-FMN oxidoreductase RutF